MRTFSRREVADQLRVRGVQAAGVLLVHTSFRAVRPIEDGLLGLIDALRMALGPDGTLVMPSWTGDDEAPFDPAATPAAGDLGVTADLFWRQPGVVRSDHLQAFAAVGPHTEAIVRTPLPLPPHVPDSPVGRVHDLDGQILLLGVGHEADTSLHLAELIAKVPYGIPRHCMVMQHGRRVRVDYVENDHCCQRFALADGWLRARGLQAEGPVGMAWRGSRVPAISSVSRSTRCGGSPRSSCTGRRRAARSATQRATGHERNCPETGITHRERI